MNALKETKKKHLLAILKYLYLHNSSTMNELVENLQLSQPSIRNMVRTLQEKQLIQEVGNDLSSGGRCPTRFALNEKNYLILCLYIQVDKVIYQVRSFSEIKKVFPHYSLISPNSLIKIREMAIGAIYLNIKMISLYTGTFSEPSLVISDQTIFLSRYHPVKMEMHRPPSVSMILAVTKSNKSKIPNPKMVNPFITPSDKEQRIPKKIHPPVTSLAALPRVKLNSSCR